MVDLVKLKLVENMSTVTPKMAYCMLAPLNRWGIMVRGESLAIFIATVGDGRLAAALKKLRTSLARWCSSLFRWCLSSGSRRTR